MDQSKDKIPGIQWEDAIGGKFYSVPGDSESYSWKLLADTPAVLWSNAHYQVLEDCVGIRFADINLSLDENGEVVTRYNNDLAQDEASSSTGVPDEDDGEPLAVAKLKDGATIIDARDYYKDQVGESLTISKAWSNNGTVEILKDGFLSYEASDSGSRIDEVTFVLHDGHWNTEVLKVRIENSEAVLEISAQLIPNQLDDIGSGVSLDLGSFLTNQLVDEGSSIQVQGLPAGLLYDSTRMRIEGTISEDAIVGEPHKISIIIHTPDKERLTSNFEWTVRDATALDSSGFRAIAVPAQQNNEEAAAAAAVLFTIASQSALSARAFTLSSTAGQNTKGTGNNGFDLAAKARGGDQTQQELANRGSGGDDLLDLLPPTTVPVRTEDESVDKNAGLESFVSEPPSLKNSEQLTTPIVEPVDELEELDDASIPSTGGGGVINDPPSAGSPPAITIAEDGLSSSINVLASASDPDGDTLIVTSAQADNGNVVINLDGTLDYTPNVNFSGLETISYVIADTSGNTALGTIDINVTPVNDAPTTTPILPRSVAEDVGLTIDVLSSASDVEGDTLAVSAASAVNGVVVVNVDNSLTYTPSLNYNGSDTITYEVSDGNGGTVQNTISVTITPVNDAPLTGVPANASTTEDIFLSNIDVLSAASDVDLDVLNVSFAAATNGIVTINPDGTLNYQPDANFNGSDTINYTISDGNGGLASNSITVAVIAQNDAPTLIIPPSSTTNEDTLLANIDVLSFTNDVDGDALSVSTASAGNGLVAINPDGTLNYTPNLNFFGPDTISYTVVDGNGGSVMGTVAITVTDVNDAPVAAANSDVVVEDSSVTIDVLANDTDIDGTLVPASVQIIGTVNPGDSLSVPGEGVWSVNTANGEITFTPEANYDGIVTAISYTVADDDGAVSSPVNVSVTITSVNDVPVAVVDGATTNEDVSVVIDVLANDNDLDGTLVPATVQILGTANPGDSLTVAGQGIWSVNGATGEITFAPDADYEGAVTDISYIVEDNLGLVSNPATVSVTLTPVNDAPVASLESATTNEDMAVVIDVLANDVDVDGTLDPATVQITGTINAGDSLSVPGEGVWSVNTANGEITFTPEANYDGVVTDITYTVEDNLGLVSNPAVVSVTLTPVNDAPTATDESVTTNEDAAIVIDVLANDSDLDGSLNPATVWISGTLNAGDSLSVPGEGVWSVNTANGEITFTPEANYDGVVTDITYTVEDNLGLVSNPATVSVSLVAQNDAPILDLSDLDNPVTNGSFSDGTTGSWSNWTATGPFSSGGVSPNSPAVQHDTLGSVSTLTQSALSGLQSGPGFNGAALISVDVGWNDVTSFPYGNPQQLTLSIDGTDYMQVTTPNGAGATANVVYLNGATGPISTIAASTFLNWTHQTLTIHLPATVSDSGDLVFTWQNMAGVHFGVTDDISIDNVEIFVDDTNPADVDWATAYQNGDPAVSLFDGTASVTDIDDTEIQSASVSLTNAESGDVLLVGGVAATNGGSGTVGTLAWTSTISGAVITIAFTGTGTHAEYLSVLSGVQFESNSGTPIASTRIIELTVNDGTIDSNVATSRIVIGVDEQPPIVVSDTGNGDEDNAIVIDVLTNDLPGDNPIDPTTVQFINTANPGDSVTVPGEGVWTINALTGAITFTPEANYNGTPTPIEYSVSDINGHGSVYETVSVTVNSVNDVPLVLDESVNGNEDTAIVVDVLANDSDVDGTLIPATVQITGTANPGDSLIVGGEGVWSVNTGNGEITFTPEANFDGVVTDITYTVQDNQGGVSNPATVSVTIIPLNDAPVAVDESATINEDVAHIFDVLANDVDVDGTLIPATVQIGGTANPGDSLTVAGEGVWSINSSNGEITFSPETNYDGVVTDITYTVEDNLGVVSNPATVSVTLTPVNDAPVAAGWNGTVNEDFAVSFTTLLNDSDVDGTLNPASVQITGTANAGDSLIVAGEGVWSVNTGNGDITFTPEANYDGAVTDITYTVMDNLGLVSNPATISVTLTPVNDAPFVIDDSATTNENVAVVIDVLGNDVDVDGTLNPASVTITGTSNPGDSLTVVGEGVWSVNTGNGEITFTPEPNYDGAVSDITYTVEDNTGLVSSPSTVSVTLTPVNNAPVAVGENANTDEDVAVVIDVLGNDSDIDGSLDPASVQITGTANPGDSLTVGGEGVWSVNTGNGEITFTPEANYNGVVSDITYTVDDNGGLTSNPATVSVTLNSVNDAPTAGGNGAATVEDVAVVISALSNDGDIDGTLNPASVQITGTANPGDSLSVVGEGVWSVNTGNGDITFTPEANYDGPVTDITYTVEDDLGLVSNPATVSLTITPVNDAPTAVGENANTDEDVAVVIDVLANDTDLDGSLDPSTVRITGTANPGDSLAVGGEGVWSVNTGNGEITFTPEANYNGVVTDITYTVDDDGGLTSNPVTVSVTLNAVNDAPLVTADSATTDEDVAVTIDVLANDMDVDGAVDPATVQITGTANPGDSLIVPGQGVWSVNLGNGEITFTPAANYDGGVTDITYTVEDNLGLVSPPATVSVVLNSINDTPTNLAFSGVNEGTSINTTSGNAAYYDAGNVDGLISQMGSFTLETVFSIDNILASPSISLITYNTNLASSGIDEIQLYINNSGGSPNLVFELDGSTISLTSGVTALLDGDIHTLSISWEPVNGDVEVHIDGALEYSATNFNQGFILDTGGNLVLGQDQDTNGGTFQSTEHFPGTFYDARVFNDVRTTAEIAGGVNTQLPGSTAGLIANWQFNDGQSTLVPDVIGGYDLTLAQATETGFTNGSVEDAVAVLDNVAAGTVVATLQASDPDLGETFTYAILSDPSGNFTIVGDELRVAAGNTLHEHFDSQHIVTISVTDSGGLSYGESITIDVLDSGVSTSPIAFDFSSDGMINVTGETTARDKSEITEIGETVEFDMDGDGDLETIEWLDGSGDALLIDNRDGDAATDMNGTRLFGDQNGQYEHGYQQLAELDFNSDGVISGEETQGLELWVDDGDARVQEGEIFSLVEMGISEINLGLEAGATDDEGRDLFRSTATLTDGTTVLTEDVWFAQVDSDDEEIARTQPVIHQPSEELIS